MASPLLPHSGAVTGSEFESSDDEHGELPLLFGRVLDGKGGARTINWAQAQHWQPAHEGEILWLHLLRAHAGVAHWLESHLGVSAPSASLLTSDANRPRAFREGECLVATLRGINLNTGTRPKDMLSVQLWSDGRHVVSLRKEPLQSTRMICKELDEGIGPSDAGALITSLTKHLIDLTSHAIINLNAMIDDLEDESIENDEADMLDKIARIRRECLSLKRHMSPQHEAFMSIATNAPSWFEDHDRRDMAETIARLHRYLDDLDISKESALVLQDDLRARAAANSQRTQYVLAIIAGIFLPLSFITGLLGINVSGIPLSTEGSHGFWIITGLCSVVLLIEVLLLRRLKWV